MNGVSHQLPCHVSAVGLSRWPAGQGTKDNTSRNAQELDEILDAAQLDGCKRYLINHKVNIISEEIGAWPPASLTSCAERAQHFERYRAPRGAGVLMCVHAGLWPLLP